MLAALLSTMLVVMKFNHLLSIFITLELVTLFVFAYVFLIMTLSFHLFLLVFLLVVASESVLGLSLFVFYIRSFSKDYVYTLSLITL